jgi:hypothetical protein
MDLIWRCHKGILRNFANISRASDSVTGWLADDCRHTGRLADGLCLSWDYKSRFHPSCATQYPTTILPQPLTWLLLLAKAICRRTKVPNYQAESYLFLEPYLTIKIVPTKALMKYVRPKMKRDAFLLGISFHFDPFVFHWCFSWSTSWHLNCFVF